MLYLQVLYSWVSSRNILLPTTPCCNGFCILQVRTCSCSIITVFVSLDASKAFNRIHYIKLFNLLLERGKCPNVCIILVYVYTHQYLVAWWNGLCSSTMDCRSGAKQGGVPPLNLFCIHIDELLSHSEQSGAGCHIGDRFMQVCCYAYDLSLLTPTMCNI